MTTAATSSSIASTVAAAAVKEEEKETDHSPPSDEAKHLDLYSNIAVTEHDFDESVWDIYEKVHKIEEGNTAIREKFGPFVENKHRK